MVWQVLTDTDLIRGGLNAKEHFRIIRDNTTRFDLFQDAVLSAPPTIASRWGLSTQYTVSEKVGEGSRRYGFFGPRKPIFGNVTRYRWRPQYFATYHSTFTPTLPENVRLIGVEIQGSALVRTTDRSDWTLCDFDVSVVNNVIHLFITAAYEERQEYDGEGRRLGTNISPTNANQPRDALPDVGEEPPNYSVTIKPIGIRDGALEPLES